MAIPKIFSRIGAAVRGFNLNNPAVPLSMSAFASLFSDGEGTNAGESINEHSALKISWVYECVRVLAESVGSLPFKLYEITDKGRIEATDHDIYFLLTVEPNPEMSAVTFWETMTGCQALTGNCYAQIVRSKDNSPAAIYPLHPLKTEPFRQTDGKLAYRTTDGMTGGGWRIISDADMIHVRTWSWDGLKGLSPVRQARESLGLAKAALKYAAKFFGKSAIPSGILSTISKQDEKQVEQVIDSWNSQSGGNKQNSTAVLWGDWKWQSVTVSPEQAQFLGTQVHSRTDVAALFRLPPHMVGDTTRLSNSNHEQQSLEFVTDTLRPILSRFENEIVRKLLPRLGRKAGKFMARFDVRERQRGDFQTTMAGLALGRQWGFLTANMCLAEPDENPLGPEGDVLLYPLNMGNAKALLHADAALPLVTAKAKLGNGKSPAPKQDPDPNAPKPAKKPIEGEVVPSENRAALGQYTPAFIRLFRDGYGRVSAREQRSSEVIQGVFGALLTSIQETAAASAEERFNLKSDWNSTGERGARIVADAMRSLAHRAESWAASAPELADETAGQEFRRVLKTIVTNTYREAGIAAFAEVTPPSPEQA
jgi:HK97 family phage portal protein